MRNYLRILIVLSSIFFSTAFSYGQWNWKWHSPVPTGSHIFKVWSFSASELIAVGSGGLIMNSLDGGVSWTLVASGVSRNLYSLYFIDVNNGWTCGESGLLLKTTDHGATWEIIETGADNLYDVCFSGTNGWACGDNGTIIKTTDGGTNWSSLNSNTNNHLNSIAFKSSTEGYVVGDGNTFLKTINGGGIWGSKAPGTNDNFTCVRISGSIVYIFGKNSAAYKTADGGSNWSYANNGLSGDILSAAVVDVNNIWAVGSGSLVYSTSDGGSNWTNKNPWIGDIDNGHLKIQGDFTCASFSSALSGIVCGFNGVIFQTTNGSLKWISRKNQLSFGDASCITFSDSLHGCLLTDTLYQTSDGGTTWNQMTNGGGVKYVQLFHDGTGIRLINSSGTTHFETTSDHGAHWTTNSGVEPPGSIFPIYRFANISTGYAVGYGVGTGGFKTNNGGVAWTSLTHDYVDQLGGFSVPDPNTIWIVELSDGSNILVSSNGGDSWTKPSISPPPDNRSAIFAFDAMNAWIGCSNGKLYKTTDGGKNFAMVDPNVNGNMINDIRFVSVSIGFVAASQGYLSVTSDGGETWNSTQMGNSDWTKIAAESENSVYVAGPKGYLVQGLKDMQVSVKELNGNLTLGFYLGQNCPNPFRDYTSITFNINQKSLVTLKIYDYTGREVAIIESEELPAGTYTRQWYPANLNNGVYFYKLEAGKFSRVRKLVIMR